VVNTRGKDA